MNRRISDLILDDRPSNFDAHSDFAWQNEYGELRYIPAHRLYKILGSIFGKTHGVWVNNQGETCTYSSSDVHDVLEEINKSKGITCVTIVQGNVVDLEVSTIYKIKPEG